MGWIEFGPDDATTARIEALAEQIAHHSHLYYNEATPEISDAEIREALDNPYGTETLAEMAKDKEQVVILFDDLTRPAPTNRPVSYTHLTLPTILRV